MPEIIHQYNQLQGGRHIIGDHPDSAIQRALELRHESEQNAAANFRATIDMHSRNSKYAPEIAIAEQYFTSQNLKPSPMRVVTSDTMARAYRVAGERPAGDSELGRSHHDRAIVIENPAIIEQFGGRYILGIALHEGAHSLHDRHNIRRTREVGKRIESKVHIVGGMAKLHEANDKILGDFMEEGFVDLFRVRALRTLGRSNDIAQKSRSFNLGDGVTCIAVPNASTEHTGNTIQLPAEYALLARDLEDRGQVATSDANYAAYALDLLDVRVHGLYEDLKAGIHDPKRQAEAIRKIESVKPGLYRELRGLEYTQKDFVKGLLLVQEALAAKPEGLLTPSQMLAAKAAMRGMMITSQTENRPK